MHYVGLSTAEFGTEHVAMGETIFRYDTKGQVTEARNADREVER